MVNVFRIVKRKKFVDYRGLNWILNRVLDCDKWKEGISGVERIDIEV